MQLPARPLAHLSSRLNRVSAVGLSGSNISPSATGGPDGAPMSTLPGTMSVLNTSLTSPANPGPFLPQLLVFERENS